MLGYFFAGRFDTYLYSFVIELGIPRYLKLTRVAEHYPNRGSATAHGQH